MTPQELRKLVLENGEELVKQYIDAALGKGKFNSTNMGAREELWDTLKSMILKADDPVKNKIDIKEAQTILEHVADGKLTLEEGERLLSMYKTVKDIERPQLEAGGTNITVVIQASDQSDAETKVINPQMEALPDGED